MADPITDERLREISQGATIYGHERNAIAAELLAAREELAALWAGGPLMRLTKTTFLDTPQEVRTRFSCEILRRHTEPEVLVVFAVQCKHQLSLARSPSEMFEYHQRYAFTKLADKLYSMLTSKEARP